MLAGGVAAPVAVPAAAAAAAPAAASFGASGFVPPPSWFADHTRDDFAQLMQPRPQFAACASPAPRAPAAGRDAGAVVTPPVHVRRSVTPPRSAGRYAGAVMAPVDRVDDSDSIGRAIRGAPSIGQHQQPRPAAAAPSSSAGAGAGAHRTLSPLQRSLDALRRRQAVRMALDRSSDDDDAGGSGAGDRFAAAPDFWDASPPRSAQRLLRDLSAAARTTPAIGDDGSGSPPPPASAPGLMRRLRALTSAQDFGEEMVLNVAGCLLRALAAAAWLVACRVGAWAYGVGYFLVTGQPLASSTSSSPAAAAAVVTAGPGVRDAACFSTWSPHELLEPASASGPMTSAFAPTPGLSAAAAAMLRPTPAPAFWWLTLLEVSGRHWVEAQAAAGFAEIAAAASRVERRMWRLHEEDVMSGRDLVQRVVEGDTTMVVDEGDHSRRHAPASQQRHAVQQHYEFTVL